MKYGILPIPLLAVAGFLLAHTPPPHSGNRLQQLRDDFPLLEILINQGVQLAGDTDSLQRAQSFHGLARALVQEIQQAAEKGREARAIRMGSYLQTVLVGGVANNLAKARGQLDNDPAKRKEWRLLGHQALELTHRFQPDHAREPTSQQKILDSAARLIQPGRAALQSVVQVRESNP